MARTILALLATVLGTLLMFWLWLTAGLWTFSLIEGMPVRWYEFRDAIFLSLLGSLCLFLALLHLAFGWAAADDILWGLLDG